MFSYSRLFRRTADGMNFLDERLPRPRNHYLTPHMAHIHDAGGIRTRNPSKRSAVEPRPGPLAQWDRKLIFW
jgi:hypothetical protein